MSNEINNNNRNEIKLYWIEKRDSGEIILNTTNDWETAEGETINYGCRVLNDRMLEEFIN